MGIHPSFDEKKLDSELNELAKGTENIDEKDPRQAARLVRKLADITGFNPGPGMEEFLRRMEAGEDPDDIGREMEELMEQDEPFEIKKKSQKFTKSRPPKIDEKLYEL